MRSITAKDLLIFACGGLLVHYYYTRKRKKGTVQKAVREVHEVIMFSDRGLGKSKHTRNSVSPGTDRVLHYLNLPKYSIDVCMYVVTHPEFCNVLLKIKLQRVKIRVIIDAEMAYSSRSFFNRLQKQCIEVRWMKSTNIMHHKFCLIDASTENTDVVPLVMTGSLNWTKQATYGNYENVMVSSQKELVEGYRMEFERLWVLFKPIA